MALLHQRNTPRDGILGSPAQRLMSRRTKTSLPTTEFLLQPASLKPELVKRQLEEYRAKQKHYYDRTAKPLPAIQLGDAVRVQTPKGWKPAEYMDSLAMPRSHLIKAGEQARLYTRNRVHLKRTAETPHIIREKIPRHLATPRRIIAQSPTVQQPPVSLAGPSSTSINPPVRPPDIRAPNIRPATVPRTRAGREVKPPGWMKDYN